mmetsp:Transcript_13936/g.24400  ORF Transcript_13936/g.24400 Transcript_13936/m.24400 type:complete len:319 (-) Transcript_13936:185-1141(-)
MRLRCLVTVVAPCILALKAPNESEQTVYSVGDLHGDFDRFKLILERLGLASFEDGVKWTGGTSILVSTGDSVDRGEHGRAIYLGFQALAEQAPKHGGEVVNILGNHELMNLQGDLRYVHDSEFRNGGDYGGRKIREREWSKTGLIGGDIRNRYVGAAIRGGSLFVHGGLDARVMETFGQNPIYELNSRLRKLLNADVVTHNHQLLGSRGPFWNRFFAEGGETQVCQRIEETLQRVGADRMVLGHTPQTEGVAVRCVKPEGPRIILADTVISRAYEPAFGFSRPSAVEYRGNQVTALYFPEGTSEPQRVLLSLGSRQEM